MESQTTKRPVTLVSAVLNDGSIVETVVSTEDRSASLLHIADDQPRPVGMTSLPGLGVVRPYSADHTLLAHGVIRFPSAVEAYETDAGLIESVRQFIHSYADLSEDFEQVAAHYVLLSWVFDAFNELPYLRLRGDHGSGKTRCLQAIGCLCYKAIFASGASTVSPLFRIIDAFRGTLVLDESDFSQSDERADVVKILNNGNAKGFPVLRSEMTHLREFTPKAFDVYGPKVIATRRAFDDAALESRCITEDLTGRMPRAGIPLSLPERFYEEGQRLRNKLLAFRARRRGQLGPSSSTASDALEPRIAQLFAPLFAVAVDEDARKALGQLAADASLALRRERGMSIEAQLLGIIEELRGQAAVLGIKDIAELYNARFGAESMRDATPRWIGAQLRSRLSIHAEKTNGTFSVPRSQYPRLDALCRRYGVRRQPSEDED